jgi:hypothetical protein
MHLTEGEPIFLEVVGVASRGRVTHMRVFTLILLYAEVEQFSRDWRIKHKIAVEEPV